MDIKLLQFIIAIRFQKFFWKLYEIFCAFEPKKIATELQKRNYSNAPAL